MPYRSSGVTSNSVWTLLKVPDMAKLPLIDLNVFKHSYQASCELERYVFSSFTELELFICKMKCMNVDIKWMEERQDKFSCCEDQLRRPTKSVYGKPWHIVHGRSVFTIKNVHYYCHCYCQHWFKAWCFSIFFNCFLSLNHHNLVGHCWCCSYCIDEETEAQRRDGSHW